MPFGGGTRRDVGKRNKENFLGIHMATSRVVVWLIMERRRHMAAVFFFFEILLALVQV